MNRFTPNPIPDRHSSAQHRSWDPSNENLDGSLPNDRMLQMNHFGIDEALMSSYDEHMGSFGVWQPFDNNDAYSLSSGHDFNCQDLLQDYVPDANEHEALTATTSILSEDPQSSSIRLGGDLVSPDNPLDSHSSKSKKASRKAPAWYTDCLHKEKGTVVDKMSMLWFGNCENTDRDLARNLVKTYFTPQDFQYVLHCQNGLEDATSYEIANRTKGKTGKAFLNFRRKGISDEMPGSSNDDSFTIQQEAEPSWYRAIESVDDKNYVITRMAYLWYGDFDDRMMRVKATRRIARDFTPADFALALDPNTNYDTMMALAKRTVKSASHASKDSIKAMKEQLRKQGISKRVYDGFMKEALINHGLDSKSFEELETYMLARCADHLNSARHTRKELLRSMRERIGNNKVPKQAFDRYVNDALEREGFKEKSVEELEAYVRAKWENYRSRSRFSSKKPSNSIQ